MPDSQSAAASAAARRTRSGRANRKGASEPAPSTTVYGTAGQTAESGGNELRTNLTWAPVPAITPRVRTPSAPFKANGTTKRRIGRRAPAARGRINRINIEKRRAKGPPSSWYSRQIRKLQIVAAGTRKFRNSISPGCSRTVRKRTTRKRESPAVLKRRNGERRRRPATRPGETEICCSL